MTPAPAFGSIDDATREEILAYAATLVFDSVTHEAASRQPLVERGDSGDWTVRAIATVVPEVGAHQNTPEALRDGRIIGRIESEGAYPALGIVAGVSYVWVDGIDPESSVATGRVLIIPADPAVGVKVSKVLRRANLGHKNNRAMAKWHLGLDGTDGPWVACSPWGCCQIG